MYGLTLVFSQKRRRSVGLRFLCSVHLITSTRSLAVVCNTVCLHHRLACLLSDCCGRRSHLGSSRVWCVSFNDSQCHWETCTAIWIYRWLDRRSGRGLAGFGCGVASWDQVVPSVPSRERVAPSLAGSEFVVLPCCLDFVSSKHFVRCHCVGWVR